MDGELKVTKVITKQVVPDTTAQIFWLKNRRPDKWREKPAEEKEEQESVSVNITIEDLSGGAE